MVFSISSIMVHIIVKVCMAIVGGDIPLSRSNRYWFPVQIRTSRPWHFGRDHFGPAELGQDREALWDIEYTERTRRKENGIRNQAHNTKMARTRIYLFDHCFDQSIRFFFPFPDLNSCNSSDNLNKTSSLTPTKHINNRLTELRLNSNASFLSQN